MHKTIDQFCTNLRNFLCPVAAKTQSEIIQNNLRDVMLHMMRSGKYMIKYFGQVVVAYSDTPGPDYNTIFNYFASNPKIADLKEALIYAQKQRYPFLLVFDRDNLDSEYNNLVSQFGFKNIGKATKVAISHKNFLYVADQKIRVKPVRTHEMLDEYCDIIDAAYGRQPNSSKNFMAPMNLLNPENDLQLYTGYLQGNGQDYAVATAMLYLPKEKDALAGHYAWAVKQQYRKQGIMTQVVQNLIQHAKQQGYSGSVAQCFDSSISLAQKIGFEECGHLQLFVNG